MHDLHFTCNCNGFEAGWMFFIVFSMLGSIFTKNQRTCDQPGFNIRGGLISGNWAWCAPPHARPKLTILIGISKGHVSLDAIMCSTRC